MLPGCPLLEELSLNYLFGRLRKYEKFSISHQTLRRLTVNRNSRDLICNMKCNTPSLVYFDYGLAPWFCSTANFLDSLLEAKINIQLRSRYAFHSELSTFIKWICNVKTLSLSSDTVEVMSSPFMTIPSFINLVKLSFESNTKPGWKVLPHLLKQSPMLETLALKGLKCCVRSKGVCIDRNEVIKVLEIYGFIGKNREFKQVDCFLGQMQFLQVLKVELDAGDKKKLRLTNRLLDLRDRSSKFQIQLL